MYGEGIREFFIPGESKSMKSKLKIGPQDYTEKSQPRILSESYISAWEMRAKWNFGSSWLHVAQVLGSAVMLFICRWGPSPRVAPLGECGLGSTHPSLGAPPFLGTPPSLEALALGSTTRGLLLQISPGHLPWTPFALETRCYHFVFHLPLFRGDFIFVWLHGRVCSCGQEGSPVSFHWYLWLYLRLASLFQSHTA